MTVEIGHGGKVGIGFRSIKEPFDCPALLKAMGKAFQITTDKNRLEKGDYLMSLGQVAFAVFKVGIVFARRT